MKKGLLLSTVFGLAASTCASLPPLHVKGMRLLDPRGRVVTLKGVNLGNWLINEFWMLGLSDVPGNPKDQFELEEVLTQRFGEKEKDRLMDVFRSSWITERDFRLMPTFGFNVVRLPMNYRLMEDDRHPFHLKPNAWKWIDRAIDLSERHGLYVILDMHGVQGGQSPYDHTGHSDQNHLKDSPEAQKRLAWLWGEIAKRYRSRGAVVAYDVMNEPYGTPKPIQVDVFKRALAEIRRNDPEKLVFAHGNYDNFDHYGDPKVNGWHNVGFQMHFYPGLFGNGRPTLATHRKHLESLKNWDAKVRQLNVPFLIGEMNVVFDSAGGAQMMRRYFETQARYGWITTMWSWKTVNREGGIEPATWGAVVNKNPMERIDFRRDSKEAIESYFRHFATEPLAVNQALRRELSGKGGPLPPLPASQPGRTAAPQETLAGWRQTDVGGALAGGMKSVGDHRFELYGGGQDIWGAQDQFRFLSREISGDFELEATIDGVEDVEDYTKAGLMIRASLDSKSPLVMVTTFPSGEVQMAHRDASGADAEGLPTRQVGLPNLRLRLVRRNGKIEAFSAKGKEPWRSLGSVPDALPRQVYAGAIALSHDNSQLVKITYRDLRLTPTG